MKKHYVQITIELEEDVTPELFAKRVNGVLRRAYTLRENEKVVSAKSVSKPTKKAQ